MSLTLKIIKLLSVSSVSRLKSSVVHRKRLENFLISENLTFLLGPLARDKIRYPSDSRKLSTLLKNRRKNSLKTRGVNSYSGLNVVLTCKRKTKNDLYREKIYIYTYIVGNSTFYTFDGSLLGTVSSSDESVQSLSVSSSSLKESLELSSFSRGATDGGTTTADGGVIVIASP
jgi:hypothetical protein